jgi:hypothetical protein
MAIYQYKTDLCFYYSAQVQVIHTYCLDTYTGTMGILFSRLGVVLFDQLRCIVNIGLLPLSHASKML